MRTILGLLALVVVLAGCGGSAGNRPPLLTVPTSTADRRDLDPCTMATDQELTAILGVTPATPERTQDPGGFVLCTWYDADRKRHLAVELLEPLISAPPGYGWTRQYFDTALGKGAKPVAGVGDDAWHRADLKIAWLYVLKGELAFAVALAYLDLNARPRSDDAILATLQPLAAAIAGRA